MGRYGYGYGVVERLVVVGKLDLYVISPFFVNICLFLCFVVCFSPTPLC